MLDPSECSVSPVGHVGSGDVGGGAGIRTSSPLAAKSAGSPSGEGVHCNPLTLQQERSVVLLIAVTVRTDWLPFLQVTHVRSGFYGVP